MNGKNINLFSREEYFDKILRRSGSTGSMKVAVNAIKCFERFSMEVFEKDIDELTKDLRSTLDENPHDVQL